MGRETITVIIPAYNCGRFIADAVESVLSQTTPPQQIVVVNDGSIDDTEARLRIYQDRITLINQANNGVAAARNAGLRAATGDFIAFLDSDDVWHRQKLELQLGVLRDRPDIQMLGTETFDYPWARAPQVPAAPCVEEVPLERLLVRNYFTASSVVIRNEIAQGLGGFDTTLPPAEDFDYWQRIAQLGVVANLKSALTGYRRVAGSLSSQPAAAETGIRRIVRKLDEQNAWRGRHWLRRRAISHLHYSIAYLHGAAGHQGQGLWNMLQSLAWYPLPYDRREAGETLGRFRRTAVLSLRLLGLKRPELPLAAGGQAGDV